jgi:anthranilate synthase component 2
MRLLVLDNYDSFTYNLVHYLEQIEEVELRVVRNDCMPLVELNWADAVVISPGPGLPHEAGCCMALIEAAWEHKPILGVCLGHQALAMHTGARLRNLKRVHHGIDSRLMVSAKDTIFVGLDEELRVGRYHSWVVDGSTLGQDWEITSTDEDGDIMSMRHRRLPHVGVQFHPESIMTTDGLLMLKNWVNAIR